MILGWGEGFQSVVKVRRDAVCAWPMALAARRTLMGASPLPASRASKSVGGMHAVNHLCFFTSSAPALRFPSRLVRSAVSSFLIRSCIFRRVAACTVHAWCVHGIDRTRTRHPCPKLHIPVKTSQQPSSWRCRVRATTRFRAPCVDDRRAYTLRAAGGGSCHRLCLGHKHSNGQRPALRDPACAAGHVCGTWWRKGEVCG